MPDRRYIELPDPNGDSYEDGSRDLLISAEHPATLPPRTDHVSLCIDGADVDLDARQIRWLVENGPTMLRWLGIEP